ncbi:MAG: 50S ribosomal protein L17 [Erysipelotrichaceae bacterium]|jgi:large subunit ribosomal protein L17|nr:50S ribosomal protein L17 [Erysipelotrichaceae bacterium]MBR2809353.1 50S ribosomal protein L17 [Erysipelotrichaceae bacterium]
MNNRKLGRTADHRKALLRNQATALILKEKIETTEMKAMELRSVVDNLITLGKKGDLASRRSIASYVFDEEAVKKVCDELATRYSSRNGGYTRVTKTGVRRGDAAPMATIELV